MRTARAVPKPWDCRKTMISRTAFCSTQARATFSIRLGPIPGSSRSLCGVSSMMPKTSTPKACTRALAKWGPIPCTMPLPRYFTIPSRVVGCTTCSCAALNCMPWVRSLCQEPAHSRNAPGVTEAAWPVTVTSSRCPATFTRSTQKPVSSLWKVTRSREPESLSTGLSVKLLCFMGGSCCGSLSLCL